MVGLPQNIPGNSLPSMASFYSLAAARLRIDNQVINETCVKDSVTLVKTMA